MGTALIQVLLIGPDPQDLEEMQHLFNSAGEGLFVLEAVDRLSKGVDLWARDSIDLVLFDLDQPDGRTDDALIEVRRCVPGVPVIGLTKAGGDGIASLSSDRDAQCLLVKGRASWPALARAVLSARKHGEQAVRDSEERYGRLLDSVTDYVYTVEMRGGTVLSTNHGHGCVAVTGFTIDEFKNDFTLWYEIIHPQDRESVLASIQEIIDTGLPVSIEHRIIRKDGAVRWVRNKQVPRHDEAGHLTAYDGLISDISERKHAEELLRTANARLTEVLDALTKSHEELKATQLQLIQIEKLHAASELAAGVAHEVKNPLAIMQMGIQFFVEQPLVEREIADSVLNEMQEALDRANSVIDDLLIFSSSREFATQDCSVASLIEDTLRLARPGLTKSGVKVVTNFEANLPTCRVDASKFRQVLANVISNAGHAMSSGGTLTINLFAKAPGGDEVNFEHGDRSGRRFRHGDKMIVTEFCDTGTGIAEDKLSRVFDPFFTTKKTGKGKGLGLSVSKKIIDLHGGEIRVANIQGGGLKVTVVIPNGGQRDDT